jgi:hypothetical protein
MFGWSFTYSPFRSSEHCHSLGPFWTKPVLFPVRKKAVVSWGEQPHDLDRLWSLEQAAGEVARPGSAADESPAVSFFPELGGLEEILGEHEEFLSENDEKVFC